MFILLYLKCIWLFGIKTNGVIEEDEAEDEEDDEGEGNDDEDDDDDYVDDEEGYVAPPAPITKKRSIDEVAEEDVDPEGSKRVKAWKSKPLGALPLCHPPAHKSKLKQPLDK